MCKERKKMLVIGGGNPNFAAHYNWHKVQVKEGRTTHTIHFASFSSLSIFLPPLLGAKTSVCKGMRDGSKFNRVIAKTSQLTDFTLYI